MANKMFTSLFRTRWTLGFCEMSLNDVLNPEMSVDIKWLKHNFHDRWFADPFILDVTPDEIILLVEEYYDPIKRGRISRMIVDRTSFRIRHLDTILELSTHLSFPAILRYANNIYIYPESGKSGELVLYNYDSENGSVQRSRILCKGELADAILTSTLGDWVMFATEVPYHNGRVLNLYKENKSHLYEKAHEYIFESNVARNA